MCEGYVKWWSGVSQMWEVVSKDDSVIFATATTAKLLPDEAVCAVQLLHVLFAKVIAVAASRLISRFLSGAGTKVCRQVV